MSVARLAKTYGLILEFCGLVAAALVLAMTALIVADVVLRNLFNTTIPASVELTEYALFYTSTFAAPWLLRRGQHIRIDVLIARLAPKAGWRMEIACDLVGIALSLLLLWFSTTMVLRSLNAQTLVVKNLIFAEWYVLWPLPVMFLLLSVEFAFRIQRLFAGPRQARREGGAV